MAEHAEPGRRVNGLESDTEHTSPAEKTTDEDTEAELAEDRPADDQPTEEREGSRTRLARKRFSRTQCVTAAGVVAVMSLGCVAGWLSYRTYQDGHTQSVRSGWVQAARQGVVNLTTIDYTKADDDIRRILDSSTGTFHDDFQKRSQPFADVLKQAQAKSEGTVTAAGLESQRADQAEVLVAVSVKMSNAGAPEQKPRAWRMRIKVQQVGDVVKMSDVQFVP